MGRTFLAAWAAIALATAGGAAAQTPKCKLVRIADWQVRVDHYRPVVDGAINGQKIGVLLDTGAARSLVRRSATTRLGLIRYDVEGERVGGETRPEYVLVDEFSIGRAARKNWRVLVAGEHDFGDDVGFILGDDFFSQVDVEFDLANNAVRLYEARDCQGVSLAYWTTKPAGEVSIEAGQELWLTAAINGQPVRAQLDSGSSTSVLAMPDAARFGVTPQTPGVVAGGCAVGLGRSVDSWIGPFESFAIGNEIIRNPTIRFADLWKYTTPAATGMPQMRLGVDFLRSHRVLIAHSQRKMYFTYTGGTVFPGRPSKGCNEPLPGAPRADPPAK